MISYLLSGWRVFVPDANGQPLYRGRVYFYDASTSEPSAVYQDKEKVTSLGTYVDVDNHGFLPPIWLEANHLYKCVVKQLIQNDPETWQTLWEIDDVGNPFITSDTDDGSSTIMVNDITLLRAIDVTSDERPDYVSVAGWFNPGDTGSPMVFRWREGEVHNEDGHWVKPSSSASLGTWEQILDDELDPRKFGAIPDTGNAVDSALVNCMRYACEPHVQDVSDPTIYKPRTVKFVRSGNYKLNSDFDFSQYVMIQAFGSAPVPVVVGDGVYFDGNVAFGKGSRIESNNTVSSSLSITNKASYAKTSWYSHPLDLILQDSPAVLVIDKDIFGQVQSTNIIGKLVINFLDYVPSSINFIDCLVINASSGSIWTSGHIDISPSLRIVGYDNGGDDKGVLFKHGNFVSAKVTDTGIWTFYNALNLPEGFQVDNDNFLMQPTGENEKYLSLKIKAILDIMSKNGLPSDIKFDNIQVTDIARIRLLSTKIIGADEDGGSYSIRFDNGAYRNFFKVYTWDMSNSGSSYAFDLIPNFSTYDKFVLVVSWWWGSSNTKSEINQFVYLNGAGGKDVGEVICVENAGPRQHDYELSGLATNGDMKVFYDKSGNIFVLGARTDSDPAYVNKIIAVIPPFTSKNFILRDNGIWDPVEL
jgi:hypothetical protein